MLKKIGLIGLLLIIVAIVAVQFISKEDSPLPDISIQPVRKLDKLPNFSDIADVSEKKESFFNTLYPIIEDESKHILKLRETLAKVHSQTQEQGDMV